MTIPQSQQEELDNWPGYNHPIACRVLRQGDQKILYPVMKQSASRLKGFIGWAKYAPSWDFKEVSRFVKDHLDHDFPRFHLVFSIGKQLVGFGSLAPMRSPYDIQVALWVASGHDGNGIGSFIVNVLEWYAFHVFGYHNVYYQHDSNNRASGRLPQKLGYEFSHIFEEEITAVNESGIWYSWKKQRPAGLAPGAIQGASLENWSKVNFPWVSQI